MRRFESAKFSSSLDIRGIRIFICVRMYTLFADSSIRRVVTFYHRNMSVSMHGT